MVRGWPLPQRKHCLIMLQVLFLASLASAVPAPEADPLLYTGHPLTYSVPYVTYHAPVCKTEIEEVKGQSCVTRPVTECNEVEVPSHKIVTEDVCQNVTTAECTHSAATTQPQDCHRGRLPERDHCRVYPLCRHHPARPRWCLLWQERGRGRPPGPRWSRPCCCALPQLRQQ